MIEELKRFLVLVEEGSFTKASKKVHLTQPALSLSIQRLEIELGKKIFIRDGKHVVLSKEGKVFYQIARRIVTLWNSSKSSLLKEAKPVYSIGVFDNAALKLSSYFQKNLMNTNYQFEITIDRSALILQGVENGLFDICIAIIPNEKIFSSKVILIDEFFEELIPVSGKVWNGKISTIPFILYNKESETRRYVDGTFLKHSVKPNVIVESTDPMFMKELAMGNAGVALLPKNIVSLELAKKKLFTQNFPFKFKRKIGVFLQKEGNLKKSDTVVKEIIQQVKT